ncbi:hypothetical protein OAK63_00580 [bacterium]|nr:hypothetical protein [bacterium]
MRRRGAFRFPDNPQVRPNLVDLHVGYLGEKTVDREESRSAASDSWGEVEDQLVD